MLVESLVQQCLLFGDQAKQSSAPLEDHGFQGTCLRDPVQSRVLKAQFKELMSDCRKTDEEAERNKSASWRAAGGDDGVTMSRRAMSRRRGTDMHLGREE